jgi:hypothetical protein
MLQHVLPWALDLLIDLCQDSKSEEYEGKRREKKTSPFLFYVPLFDDAEQSLPPFLQRGNDEYDVAKNLPMGTLIMYRVSGIRQYVGSALNNNRVISISFPDSSSNLFPRLCVMSPSKLSPCLFVV